MIQNWRIESISCWLKIFGYIKFLINSLILLKDTSFFNSFRNTHRKYVIQKKIINLPKDEVNYIYFTTCYYDYFWNPFIPPKRFFYENTNKYILPWKCPFLVICLMLACFLLYYDYYYILTNIIRLYTLHKKKQIKMGQKNIYKFVSKHNTSMMIFKRELLWIYTYIQNRWIVLLTKYPHYCYFIYYYWQMEFVSSV